MPASSLAGQQVAGIDATGRGDEHRTGPRAVVVTRALAGPRRVNLTAAQPQQLGADERLVLGLERCRQLGLNQNRFESCLLRHKVLFVEGLNPENDILGRTPRISVEQYLLQQGKELKQTFRIADIKLFGDFEHF